MPNKNKKNIPSQYILFILTIAAVLLLFFSYATGFSGGVFEEAAAYIFTPMEKGITYFASSVEESLKDRESKEQLISEKEALTKEVETLREDLTKVQLEQDELYRLRELLALKDTYTDYPTTGARVIASGQDNWFSTFTIDKGSADGIEKDMNIIAGGTSGGGLCGIVTQVRNHSSVVRSIIDDTTSVSGMIVSTEDNCIVSGNRKTITTDNTIGLSNLEDSEDRVNIGDPIVTSYISDKYVPGILIGYVTSLDTDPSKLTKSGTVTPVCDFRHISEVLVVMQKKEISE